MTVTIPKDFRNKAYYAGTQFLEERFAGSFFSHDNFAKYMMNNLKVWNLANMLARSELSLEMDFSDYDNFLIEVKHCQPYVHPMNNNDLADFMTNYSLNNEVDLLTEFDTWLKDNGWDFEY